MEQSRIACERLSNENASKSTQLDQVTTENARPTSALEAASTEKRRLTSALTAASTQREDAGSALKAASTENERLTSALDAASIQRDDAKGKLHQAELDIVAKTSAIQLEATKSISSLQSKKTVLEAEVTTLRQRLSAAETEARVANQVAAQAAVNASQTAQNAIHGMALGQQGQVQTSMAHIQATGQENQRMHDTSRALMQYTAQGQAREQRTALFRSIVQQGNGMPAINQLLMTAFSNQGGPIERHLLNAIQECPPDMANPDKVSQTIAKSKQVLQFYGQFWDDWRKVVDRQAAVAAPSSLVDLANVELITVALEFIQHKLAEATRAVELYVPSATDDATTVHQDVVRVVKKLNFSISGFYYAGMKLHGELLEQGRYTRGAIASEVDVDQGTIEGIPVTSFVPEAHHILDA